MNMTKEIIDPELIDFPVSYDRARWYDPTLPPIDDRLPWQREESARLDAAIARLSEDESSDDMPGFPDAELDRLSRRSDYLQSEIAEIKRRLKWIERLPGKRQEAVSKGSGVEL